jgi:hypothetical protein
MSYNQYTEPNAEEVHITAINHTRANLVSFLDNCQIGIAVDGVRHLVYKDHQGNLIDEHGSKRFLSFAIYDADESVRVANGISWQTIPAELSGYNLKGVTASVYAQGTGSLSTTIQVRRRRGSSTANMLYAPLSIGYVYYAESTAVDTGNDDLITGDQIFIDILSTHQTVAPLGLSVCCSFGAW